MQKRLAEIEARKREIREQAEGANDEQVRAMMTEADALNAEATELRGRMELRGKLEPTPAPKGGANEAEERGRDLKQSRAVTVTGGTLVNPVGTQDSVNGLMGRNVSSIVDLVKTADLNGLTEYQVPYVKTLPTADKTTENTDAPAGDVVFDYAAIKPISLAIYSEISHEAMNLNDAAYYEAVVAEARRALRRKVAEYIVKSDAATGATFIGVLAATAIDAATDLTLSAIDAGTLRKIMFSYGGDEDVEGEGVLFLSKKDLITIGDIRGTNEKKPVFEITPDSANTNTGIIKDGGLAVRYCLNSNITALADTAAGKYSMFYGVPSAAYELGIFSPLTIKVSTEAAFRKRMLAILGEIMIGGNVVVKNGFVRVKKSTT